MVSQIEMVVKRFVSTIGDLGFSHQIGSATLNGAILLLDCRMAVRAPPVLALPA